MKWIGGAMLAAVSIAATSPAVAQQWSALHISDEAGFFGIGSVMELESGLKSVWLVDADPEISDGVSYTVRNIYFDCDKAVSISQTAVAYDASDRKLGEASAEYLGSMASLAPSEPIDPETIMGLYHRIACENERRPQGPLFAQAGPMIARYRASQERRN